jgi:arylsulfatase
MSARRPNVLHILSDQHNAKVTGYAGHPDVKTPNLDRLASQGVRFDSAVTQNPICTPSRVSWLSGQYCHNHGYYGLSGPNPRGLPNIFDHFRRGGYATAAIGKIHCPEYWIEDSVDLFRETCGTSIGGQSAEYAAYLEERGLTDLEDHGAMQEFGKRGVQTVEGRPSKVSYEDGQEGWIVRRGIEFMREAKAAGKPFIFHASLPKPHQCYTPAQQFWDLYEESKLTLPPNADYEMAGKAPHLRDAAKHWRSREWQLFEPKTFEAGRLRKLHGYLGNVSHVDHAVGELLDFLDEEGIADDTIVVYSADHGDYACEHGIMEKAPGICSDAITRVPSIWRWPGRFAEGAVIREVIESIDFAKTVPLLAGLDDLETADGVDISAMLEGKPGDPDRAGLTEFAWSRSLRWDRYRFVFYPKPMFAEEHPDGFCELYDLTADPWEMTNLALDGKHDALVNDMRARLLDKLVASTRPATVLGLPEATGDQRISRYHNTVNRDCKVSPARLAEIRTKNYL